jgi:glycosyltransferase A (GT-A) superfamily protein (DUF2064 family)
MANGRTILLFTRAPEAEARAKHLPLADGSRLFAGFLRAWRHRADEAGAELLVVTPASSTATLARLLPDASLATQAGDSFAARIESAFALAFGRGTKAVLMVGGDGPPLPAADILHAFAHLESEAGAAVLTPSSDGGVNAIGFNARAERRLAGIAWQSSDVCGQLMEQAREAGLALFITPTGHDLDCAGNVALLYRLSRAEPHWRAFRWLLQALLMACRSTVAFISHAIGEFSANSHLTRGPPLSSLA